MKTKKILAMLSAITMLATTLATTQVWAEEELVNISSAATMSSTLSDGAYNPWPIAQAVDGSIETTAGVYNATENDYIQADFGCTQSIKEIVVENANPWGWAGTGKARVIQLSNDPNFASYEEMTCYERVNGDNANSDYVDYLSKWSYAGDMSYRYVRIYPTPAAACYTNWGDDQTPSFAIKELYVYATELTAIADISSKATMSSTLADGAFNPWPIAQAVDGSIETTAGVYGASEDSYIQADFGQSQDIKEIVVDNANPWGWTGTGKARVIRLSNDPNFTNYEEMVCYLRVNDENGNVDYVDHQSKWMYTGDSSYRYVRIYPTPAAAGYTNWGDDQAPSFAIRELYVYATQGSAELENVIAGKVPTLTNSEFMFGTSAGNLTDGNNDTVAYSVNSLAVFELDNTMDIERVEIDLRADGEVTDADRHYEVYLSNTGTKEGALKLLDVSANHQQIAYNTIVLPVDSTYGYKYVLVGSESNFWGLTEVRAMSNGEYAAPYTAIEIDEVDMGGYAGKAWDVVLNEFDSSKTYTAVFADGEDTKEGTLSGVENAETDGSVAFAIFLHTQRANVALDIVAE